MKTITILKFHAAAILWRMYHEIPEMKKEYEKFHPLAFFSTASINLHTKNKAPRSLDDVKGLKIGTPGPVLVKMIKALGGSAQQLKPGDMYMALQRGMIQGTLFADAPMRSYRLTELIEHHTMLNIAVDGFAVGMNSGKWESLPPDASGCGRCMEVLLGVLAQWRVSRWLALSAVACRGPPPRG